MGKVGWAWKVIINSKNKFGGFTGNVMYHLILVQNGLIYGYIQNGNWCMQDIMRLK
jgi:hypothetical protein